MENEVCIISVIYKEPEWEETEKLIDAIPDVPAFFVDRDGIGSLARAVNAGVNAFAKGYEYCWIVTNVTFQPDILPKLLEAIKEKGYAGITPAFNSDHKFCRPGEGISDVPFIEFTAALVRTDVMVKFPLDEKMPYWGHDLDWGYRVRKAKHKLGCLRSVSIGHTYIRDSKSHPVTLERQRLRKASDATTTRALIAKHGANWRRKLKWQG